MQHDTQYARAKRLLELHHGSDILVLPNAWDVVTARIFEREGAVAIATTSGGIAASFGHADGERVALDVMLGAIARIAGAVSAPVTADVEGGYAQTAEDVARTIEGVLAAGAVGVNLEDADHHGEGPLIDIDLHVRKVRAARGAADCFGVPLVINARTDVFLAEVGPEEERLDLAIRRVNAYLEAGADSAFVPGVKDAPTITALVRGIDGPLNVLAGPGVPSVPELRRLGVARVSVGSGPARATFALVQDVARELLGAGTYTAFSDEQLPQDKTAALFAPIQQLTGGRTHEAG